MSSTWIDTPIENAKEVVYRTISAMGGFDGKVITYEDDCEVYFSTNDLTSAWTLDTKYVYYGYFHSDTEITGMRCVVEIGAESLYTFDTTFFQQNGYVRPCIWNNIPSTPSNNIAFIGYKFKVDYPVQYQQRIKFNAPYQTGAVFDIGTFGNSQDDTSLTLVDGEKNIYNWGLGDSIIGSPIHIETNQVMVPGNWEIRCDSDINYANLTYIAGESDFMDLELVACSELTYLDISSWQSLQYQAINKIMSQFVHFGKLNGTLKIYQSYQTQTMADPFYTTLINRGWNITF